MKRWFLLSLVSLSLLLFHGLSTQRTSPPLAPKAALGQQQDKKKNDKKKQRANQKRKNQNKKKNAAAQGQPKLQGELAAERASAPAPQADFPSVATTSDGAIWVSYLEWNRGETDRVVVRRKPAGGSWSDPIELDDGCFEHYIPAMAARGNKVLVVWSGHEKGGFDLYSAEVAADGSVSSVQRLTDAPHSDMNVRCRSDAQGDVTVVWQSFRSGQSDIYARQLRGDSWGQAIRVSPSQLNDWEPTVALDSQGTAWIAWDSYEHGNYDVFVRSFDGRSLGDVIAVTTEATAQFHSTIAVDQQDRIWVAWDEAGINWGKDYSRSSAVESSRGVHFSRTLDLRVIENGNVRAPLADVKRVLTGSMQRYAQLPHLATDASGALWLVFRHWTIKKPHEMFDFYATQLGPDGWTTPYRLANSSGRNTQHAELALARDGSLQVVYSSDGRGPEVMPPDAKHALSYVVYVSSLPRGQPNPDVRLRNIDLPN